MKLCIFLITIGRPTLPRMLESIKRQSNLDQVRVLIGADDNYTYVKEEWEKSGLKGDCYKIITGPHPPYGAYVRNYILPAIKDDYVWHVDDDDVLLPNAVEFILSKLITEKTFHIHTFYRHYDKKIVGRPVLRGHTGTPNLIHPTGIEYGHWGEEAGGDGQFVVDTIEKNKKISTRIYYYNPIYYAYPPHEWTVDECWDAYAEFASSSQKK